MKKELTIEEEMDVLYKYKKELICPYCQKELVSKDYKVNKLPLKLIFSALIGGIIIGVLI